MGFNMYDLRAKRGTVSNKNDSIRKWQLDRLIYAQEESRKLTGARGTRRSSSTLKPWRPFARPCELVALR